MAAVLVVALSGVAHAKPTIVTPWLFAPIDGSLHCAVVNASDKKVAAVQLVITAGTAGRFLIPVQGRLAQMKALK